MQKEDIGVLAQLLQGIKDTLTKIEEAQEKGDGAQLDLAKKEALQFQKKVAELLV